MKNMFVVIAAVGLLAGAACESPTAPDLLVEPIQVDRVDVLILESFPVQATAHVTGVVGDGCSELHSVTQRREGNVVTVTILRKRPTEAICTQIAKLYDENIRLEGAFPAGRWVLRVNGVETSFES